MAVVAERWQAYPECVQVALQNGSSAVAAVASLACQTDCQRVAAVCAPFFDAYADRPTSSVTVARPQLLTVPAASGGDLTAGVRRQLCGTVRLRSECAGRGSLPHDGDDVGSLGGRRRQRDFGAVP